MADETAEPSSDLTTEQKARAITIKLDPPTTPAEAPPEKISTPEPGPQLAPPAPAKKFTQPQIGVADELTKTWTEIEVDPKYRAEPAPMRGAIRDRFFNTVVLPRYKKKSQEAGIEVGEPQFADLRKTFDTMTHETPFKYGDPMQGAVRGEVGLIEGVDYLEGLPFGELRKFFEADNDRERFKTLAADYGKANVGIDPGGRWWVKDKDGKRKAVVGANILKNLGAEGMAEAPETIGMMGAAALAPGTGGGSMLAPATKLAEKYGLKYGVPFLARQLDAVAGLAAKSAPAVAGAVGGKVYQEGIKAVEGRLDKSVGEELRAVGKEGLGALVGDAAFRGLSAFGRRYFLDTYARASSESEKKFAALALREGFRPSVAQARGETKGAPLWRFAQSVYDKVFGGAAKREKINYTAINQKLDAYLDSVGIPADRRAEFKQRLLNKDFAIDEATETLGKPVQADFAAVGRDMAADEIARKDRAARLLLDEINKAKDTLARETDRIVKKTGPVEHPILAAAAENVITEQRSRLGKIASGLYEAVWSLAGAGAERPTTALKRAANELWGDVVKTAEDEQAVVTKLDAFKKQIDRILTMGPTAPLRDLASLRTEFYNTAEDRTLTPSVESGRYRKMADTITAMLAAAEKDPGVTGEAAKLLRQTNEWYAQEIGKFDIAKVVQLGRTAGESGARRAEDIPKDAINPAYPSTLAAIRGVIGEPLFQKVAATRFDDLVRAATTPEGTLDAQKLAAALTPFVKDGFARKVWGDVDGRAIERLQRDAARLAEFIQGSTLTPSTVAVHLDAAAAAKKAADAFWANNLMAEIAAGGARQERAIERLARMENLAEIKQAKAYFGENSPEMMKVRQFSLQHLLGQAIETSDSPFGQPLTGKGFAGVIAKVGRDKLTEMFGPAMADDLYHLGDMIRYVTAKQGDSLVGALRAGSLMFHPISHFPAIIQNLIEGKLMMRPGFIRWITLGLEGDNQAIAVVRELTRVAAFGVGQELAGAVDAPPNEWNHSR